MDVFSNMHSMSKDEFFEKIFVGAFQLIPEAEKGSFYELQGDKYVPIIAKGYDFNVIRNLSFNRDKAFVDYKCSDTADIDANEIYIEKRDDSIFTEETINTFKKLGTYSNFTSLYAPIQVNGINVGMISLEHFSREGFSKNSKKIFKFYAQIISDFYSQKVLHDNESRMYKEVVTALVSAIEVKDKYTEGHAQRVRKYSCAIAKKLDLSKEKVEEISTAALLHDIGKIGISTEILNKPGKLTAEEYDVIKKHPIYTKQILHKISGFYNIEKLAYCHHENYDGSGYPQGLKGNEIPFEAQIIQVADAYDAMTSERAYRRALPNEVALNIVKEEMGKQFNPKVAEAAIELFLNKIQ